MTTAVLKVNAGVRFGGIRPELGPVLDCAPKAFARFGHDCVLTSCCRDGDGSSKHDVGLACDFDSSYRVQEQTGHAIASTLKLMLGEGYDVLWHRAKRKDGSWGNWHLHVEWDPK